jgi:NAD(P)-dependent dehydrogenase (short-subunit alcohol dehydrogenase family)
MAAKMKHILITGVSTGIGYDAVRFLLEKGYYVFGSVRKEEDKIKLEADFPNNFSALIFDVTNKDQLNAGLAQVKVELNGAHLCALVNNAGLAVAGPLQLLSEEKFRQQMEVNLFGAWQVTNAFLPLLGAYKGFTGTPGKIINISSLSGIFNTPFIGAYCISKHAMESMGEVYRRELMLYGIDVVSIQSGPIASKIWEKNIKKTNEFVDSDYSTMMTKVDRIMKSAQRRALPAEVISKLIYKILSTKKPKCSYIVNSNKLRTIIMVKYLPSRVVDGFIKKLYAK